MRWCRLDFFGVFCNVDVICTNYSSSSSSVGDNASTIRSKIIRIENITAGGGTRNLTAGGGTSNVTAEGGGWSSYIIDCLDGAMAITTARSKSTS